MKPLKSLGLTLILILHNSSLIRADNLDKGPNLGQTIESRILDANAARDIFPDGEGMPSGEGTVSEGEVIYQNLCLSCHGPKGRGASAEALAGGEGTLSDEYPDQTIGLYWPYATTLLDVIRRSMPLNNPASLSNDDVYSVSAYLLSLNGVLGDLKVLNQDNFASIKMPNKDGFISKYKK